MFLDLKKTHVLYDNLHNKCLVPVLYFSPGFVGNGWQQAKPVEIVRQSMPFGSLSSEAGLFFIGYAASPQNFEYMLDRMVGARDDSNCDDIMKLSKNIKGTYWYFPGADELKKFA